jgi:hypothetical protein
MANTDFIDNKSIYGVTVQSVTIDHNSINDYNNIFAVIRDHDKALNYAYNLANEWYKDNGSAHTCTANDIYNLNSDDMLQYSSSGTYKWKNEGGILDKYSIEIYELPIPDAGDVICKIEFAGENLYNVQFGQS